MDLSHNSVFWILSGEHKGLYRVIFDYPIYERVIVARIGEAPSMEDGQSIDAAEAHEKNETKKSKKGKKSSQPLVGRPIALSHTELNYLETINELRFGEIRLPSLYYEKIEPPQEGASKNAKARYETKKKLLDRRVAAMQPFLDLTQLWHCLANGGTLADLMKLVAKPRGKKNEQSETCGQNLSKVPSPDDLLKVGHDKHPVIIECSIKEKAWKPVSYSQAYKCWSLLCLYGFHESSLRIRFDRCGAPGVLRPCDPDGRMKAGAKTEKQRQIILSGESNPPPEQPGTSTKWFVLVTHADNKIPNPKPRWPRRCEMIVDYAFIREFEDDNGKLVRIPPEQGTYPNNAQIKRIITVETPKIEQIREKTTSGHFDRSLRGLTGKSWDGVVGPGHTWAIDSTVGDVYLRSSIKRSWVIGRPIVYTIVDVWSTAVVGFYVCLSGPSWDMAKIALFCAAARPQLISELWGYPLFSTLKPFPTLPYILMCDRGEYLSKAAKQTGVDLRFQESFAPPYRPDLKGIVEVMHRIAKDEQFEFVPGSIDARRIEMERRKFDPTKAVFTVREYVEYLYGLFNNYNLTADRNHRMDTHMRAQGVQPTPAGLWNYGHGVGLGYSRKISEEKLVTDLLPSGTMTITSNGVRFARALYQPPEEKRLEWATLARSFGRFKVDCHYFPGSTSQIWTPYNAHQGIMKLGLAEQSTVPADATFDEVADIYKYDLQKRAEREHQSMMHRIDWLDAAKNQIEKAKKLTKEALEADSTDAPTLSDARAVEVLSSSLAADTPSVTSAGSSGPQSQSSTKHLEMMNDILNSELEDA